MRKKGRLKLPEDPRRKQQVKTFVEKYGRQGYQQAGSLGGKKSPTRFNSESARRANLIGQQRKRERREAAEREKNGNENGLSSNEEN